MRRLLFVALIGCSPPAVAPKPSSEPPPTAAPSEPAAPAPTPAPSEPPPTRQARAARDSYPEGVRPLDDAEQTEMKEGCKKLVDALAAVVKKKNPRGRLEATTAMIDALAEPPAAPGVDVAHCSELVRRDLEAYLAAAIETEAIVALRTIALGLASAAQSDGVVCASAPAAPADLEKVHRQSYTSTAADWAADGWRCTRFGSPGMPLRWQYQVKTDAAARSFEIVARGFPVAGAAAAELFLTGKVDDPSPGEVMRR